MSKDPSLDSCAPESLDEWLSTEPPVPTATADSPSSAKTGFGGLTAFERKTLFWGRLGFALTFGSLLAASVAVYFAFQQAKEMASQTALLVIAQRQAQTDAKDSSVAVAKQLGALQEQMTQQRQSVEVDQRPWLKFRLGGNKPTGSDPNGLDYAFQPFIAGKPLSIPIRVTNIGKTTAEHIKGAIFVQVVSKGKEPMLPSKRLSFAAPDEPTPSMRGKSVPAEGWLTATLYPGEVVEGSPSRMKRLGDGTIVIDPVTSEEADGINGGSMSLYILGEVWYADVFGVQHWSRFCETTDRESIKARIKCVRFGAVDHNRGK